MKKSAIQEEILCNKINWGEDLGCYSEHDFEGGSRGLPDLAFA
jgi:hypothetical protein